MSRQNKRDEDLVATVAGVAAGAAAVYTGYKLLGALFGSKEEEPKKQESSFNVGSTLNNMSVAYAGYQLGSFLHETVQKPENQETISNLFSSVMNAFGDQSTSQSTSEPRFASIEQPSIQRSVVSSQQGGSSYARRAPQSIPYRIISSHTFPSGSKIYVVNTVEECRFAIRELKSHCDEMSVLGFDCEWEVKPGQGRQKIALLQLASHRGLCALIRLSKLKQIPSELKEILGDPMILKVGVATYTDVKHLNNDYLAHRVQPWTNDRPIRGTFELGRLANMANCGGLKWSLAKMTDKYLGVTLDKDSGVRRSEWEADTLSDAQITYAATDAMVAIELFKYFGEKYNPNSTYRNSCNRMQKVIEVCCEINNDE